MIFPSAQSIRKGVLVGEETVVIGAGQIGQAIARRVSAGKHVVLADLHQANADAAAEVLADAGFDIDTATVDVSSRESVYALVRSTAASGHITGVIHAAGVSPSQAPPEAILAVDLYGTAVVLEQFGNVIASGGAGVVIASQSGHRLGALTPDQTRHLPQPPQRNYSPCRCFSQTRLLTRSTRTSLRSAGTLSESWPSPSVGPSAVPG
jgi:NAD(P)-dependent dehydrogenase (short-subunit alcohol dehydrogenase family)